MPVGVSSGSVEDPGLVGARAVRGLRRGDHGRPVPRRRAGVCAAGCGAIVGGRAASADGAFRAAGSRTDATSRGVEAEPACSPRESTTRAYNAPDVRVSTCTSGCCASTGCTAGGSRAIHAAGSARSGIHALVAASRDDARAGRAGAPVSSIRTPAVCCPDSSCWRRSVDTVSAAVVPLGALGATGRTGAWRSTGTVRAVRCPTGSTGRRAERVRHPCGVASALHGAATGDTARGRTSAAGAIARPERSRRGPRRHASGR
jgi:hypothetical protein